MSSSATPRRRGRPALDAKPGAQLREALLIAGLDQLGTVGDPREVTVKSLCTAAGCTAPTLYHYWPDKDALLREACQRGFAEFAAAQEQSVRGMRDPIERIRARGRSYLDFAMARPTAFRVLLLPGPQSPAAAPADLDEPGAGLAALRGDVSEAITAGHLGAVDPTLVSVCLWSLVHGIATLWTTTPGMDPEFTNRLLELGTDALLTGLAPCPSP